jgi:hypothetical protein
MSQPIELLLQALENVGNSFGGNTGRVLLAVVREYKRLKRYEEDQETRRLRAKQKEMEKEYKITGKWPDGDDDIPF